VVKDPYRTRSYSHHSDQRLPLYTEERVVSPWVIGLIALIGLVGAISIGGYLGS